MGEERDDFQDAYIDTGATKSVVGRIQAEAYCKYISIPLFIEKFPLKVFRFGGQKSPRLWKAKLRIPYGYTKEMDFNLDIVDVNVPLLL